jgi:isopenicillin N synthase-like dioxygenase
MHSNLEPQIAPEEVADLEVIDYQKLLALNASEQFRVAKACEDRGFFILRVEHAGYEEIWDQARKTFDVAKQAFGLPEEQKERFHMALSGTSELSGHGAI